MNSDRYADVRQRILCYRHLSVITADHQSKVQSAAANHRFYTVLSRPTAHNQSPKVAVASICGSQGNVLGRSFIRMDRTRAALPRLHLMDWHGGSFQSIFHKQCLLLTFFSRWQQQQQYSAQCTPPRYTEIGTVSLPTAFSHTGP